MSWCRRAEIKSRLSQFDNSQPVPCPCGVPRNESPEVDVSRVVGAGESQERVPKVPCPYRVGNCGTQGVEDGKRNVARGGPRGRNVGVEFGGP